MQGSRVQGRRLEGSRVQCCKIAGSRLHAQVRKKPQTQAEVYDNQDADNSRRQADATLNAAMQANAPERLQARMEADKL